MTGRALGFLIGIALLLGMMVPAQAFGGSWLSFFSGTIAPASNEQTSSHQARYGKWTTFDISPDPGVICGKNWYRNNGSSTDYYEVSDCVSGVINDDRNSTADAWSYCRNIHFAYYVTFNCRTCVNGEC